MKTSDVLVALLLAVDSRISSGFAPAFRTAGRHTQLRAEKDENAWESWMSNGIHAMTTIGVGLTLASSTLFAGPAFADTAASSMNKYDGFAEYAKENKMEQSDVGCFMSKCGDQTKNLFSNPRGIKGVSCLGRCKGEQSCAMRCFADFGSEDLNNWLSCTIEDYECVKVPKNIDNSAEDKGYDETVKDFDPKSLIGTWYKTDGLNPNYDLFDCQTNTFTTPEGVSDSSELDMGIFFRISRPKENGGGFWDNQLVEHMVVDGAPVNKGIPNPAKRTMHTSGRFHR